MISHFIASCLADDDDLHPSAEEYTGVGNNYKAADEEGKGAISSEAVSSSCNVEKEIVPGGSGSQIDLLSQQLVESKAESLVLKRLLHKYEAEDSGPGLSARESFVPLSKILEKRRQQLAQIVLEHEMLKSEHSQKVK